jgi:hypothetical protein
MRRVMSLGCAWLLELPADTTTTAGSAYRRKDWTKLAEVGPRGVVLIATLAGCGRVNFDEHCRIQGIHEHAVLATTGGSLSAALADLNHDDRLDVVAASVSVVDVFLAAGDGTFAPRSTFDTAASAGALLVVDLNGDGNLDVAVPDFNDGVSVLLGTATGTLLAHVDYPVGDQVTALIGADLDGDGDLDLIAASVIPPAVAVLRGRGDGTFEPRVQYAAGIQPRDLETGDFNDDGRLDVVVANGADHTVGVFLGMGDGTLQARIDSPAGGMGTAQLAVGHLDENATLDLVVANDGSNTAEVLLGDGRGGFRSAARLVEGFSSRAIALAHLDGDASLDVIVTNELHDVVNVLAGRGDGTFRAVGDYATGQGDSHYWVATGDVDRDGVTDIAIPNVDVSTISVFTTECD